MFNYTVETIQEKMQNRYLLVTEDKRIFSISELLYHILLLKKDNTITDEQVADAINQSFPLQRVTALQIKAAVTKTMRTVKQGSNLQQPALSSYIMFQRTLIRSGAAHGLYKLCSLLFSAWLFRILSCTAIVATASFISMHDWHLMQHILYHPSEHLSAGSLIMLYAIFLLIILSHEIGHAAAAYSFGIMPEEIGIGLYFIYPVFFTNVTCIWKLPLQQRIIVNLGGIYFQLLINLVLIALFYGTSFASTFYVLIIINTISVLSSLNPFFRFDGYWILSDWFGLPNLRIRSLQLVPRIISGKAFREPVPVSLIIYTLFNMLFWIIMGGLMIQFICGQVMLWTDMIHATRIVVRKNLLPVITGTAGVLLIIFLLTKSVYQTYQIFKHAAH